MKTEQIKQMAEAKALYRFPNRFKEGVQYDFNEESRAGYAEGYAQAIIDTYKEEEEQICKYCQW